MYYIKLAFYELTWRWRNRKWNWCRAKRRALEKYLLEKGVL